MAKITTATRNKTQACFLMRDSEELLWACDCDCDCNGLWRVWRFLMFSIVSLLDDWFSWSGKTKCVSLGREEGSKFVSESRRSGLIMQSGPMILTKKWMYSLRNELTLPIFACQYFEIYQCQSSLLVRLISGYAVQATDSTVWIYKIFSYCEWPC